MLLTPASRLPILRVFSLAYRKLAQQWHPDKYKGDDLVKAQNEMAKINMANEVLSDDGTAYIARGAAGAVLDHLPDDLQCLWPRMPQSSAHVTTRATTPTTRSATSTRGRTATPSAADSRSTLAAARAASTSIFEAPLVQRRLIMPHYPTLMYSTAFVMHASCTLPQAPEVGGGVYNISCLFLVF